MLMAFEVYALSYKRHTFHLQPQSLFSSSRSAHFDLTTRA
jgi:hypothetical protein